MCAFFSVFAFFVDNVINAKLRVGEILTLKLNFSQNGVFVRNGKETD